MIPLVLQSRTDAETPFVVRLERDHGSGSEAILVSEDEDTVCYSTSLGLLEISGAASSGLDNDVVLVHPGASRIERLLRAGSKHNTLLVTERCDQLCVMCSQPPKKTHHDRFDLLEEACLLAEPDLVIGITGGEPTLYKQQLFGLIERVRETRPDLSFHVLTNGQHFLEEDIERLRQSAFDKVVWGIPLYAADAAVHDGIVAKPGAFATLEKSLAILASAGARIELRTVLLATNHPFLPRLARYVGARLRFLEAWSLMQLENIGFARNRWDNLFVDHAADFSRIGETIDIATMRGIPIRLFNFPRCSVPETHRYLALASISDWKRKYADGCESCTEQNDCCGFFEWHPEAQLQRVSPL